jgi:hypothetical protein
MQYCAVILYYKVKDTIYNETLGEMSTVERTVRSQRNT